MFRLYERSFAFVLAALAAIFAGCGNQSEPAPGSSPSAPATSSDEDAEVQAALAKLSPADRELAEAQKICPVSDELLGSMGTPLKITVEDRDVFVCCAGCEDELKENFDKYLAKLDQKPAEN